ncbi:mitochondrial ribonuclease P catalytic subunit isoform X3 [Cryptotermes secundus]|uniref:mitochondrial ribonuclease P catalytic subunit isoform X3 n=1 Tax=Cryptotermes secundus TaxID=105785 RepID=UPI000CD7DBAE|nr:mitochondrial ribonuclease P catalytic subunit isoform X3 [Cryptotermes secundus]
MVVSCSGGYGNSKWYVLIMSGPLKCIFSLQKCLQTFATLRCLLPSVYISTRECKWSGVNLCPAFRIATFPGPTHSFSTDISKNDTCAVLQSQDEKNSDSDEDNTAQDEDILVSVITKGKQLSSSEWEKIKDQVLAKNRGINGSNIDAITIGLCGRFMQLDMGLSYLEHLSLSGKKLNIATIAQVMRMCYSCRLKGIDEQFILSMYENLHSRCPVLDGYTAESAILGLCLTRHWKVGLDLLDMAKLTCIPGGMEYNVLVKTAYDNNEPNISLRLINEMLQLGRSIRPEVFHAQLDYCNRMSAGEKVERWKMVEEILSMFVEHDLKPTVDVAERIRVWYLEAADPHTEVQAQLSSVTDGGICKSCQKYLNPITITKEEFGALQSAFMDKVVVGADIFRKSTPEEIKEFKNFVKMTAPYDMVIDGLNIAFTAGPKKALSSQALARTLHHVVKYFVMKSKKVLILGRKHMQTWSPCYMDYIYRNAHVFLADNLGMGTKFLSRDLMRGHAYRLENKSLRSTFKLWQLQHQCQLKYVTQAGKVHLKFPLTFNPMAQVSRDGSWHIPYEMEFVGSPSQSFEAPTTWLCLRSGKSSPSLSQVRHKKISRMS